MPVRDSTREGPQRALEGRNPEGSGRAAGAGASPARDEESIAEFLTRLRPPFAFVVRNPKAAGRTSVPAGRFATRATVLAQHCDEETSGLLVALGEALSRYESAATAERPLCGERCLALIDTLMVRVGGSEGWREQESRARAAGKVACPEYRPSEGDPATGLEELSRSVQFLRGVGPRRAEVLRKFGISTVGDLLYHLPFRYEDRRRVRKIAELQVGETASVMGELTHVGERVVGRARRGILEAVVRDATGLLGLTWYHQLGYFRNRFRIGQKCLVYGKVERPPGGSKRMVHPEIDLDPDDGGQGILPVYNKPATMTVGGMRKLVQQAVREFARCVPSALPPAVAQEAQVCDLETALRALHLPEADADIAALDAFSSLAHRSMVFDELFYLHVGMTLRRRTMSREEGLALTRTGRLTEALAATLPFQLTHAQRRVIEEVSKDMAEPHPMHRLVQGDVGSGKTIVALFAALVAIENGYQAAFMAPTELLAEQHFRTVERFISELGVSGALLTGERTRSVRKELYAGLADGSIQLAVGTHALIQEGVRFAALGIGIIDEQHRFGVLQRAALRGLGDGARTPDMLLMTATPIPRTLALTVYGDLDVSVLDELPPTRKPVRTLLMNEAERSRVYQLVKEELDGGRQGYVVYPLVESSEKEDLRDATTMARELGRTVFAGYRVGLVHGRMKADEKDAVMRRFRSGDLQLLVSTTVIEVGVDVPDATILVVEHADRFGLSQLHQLRGRVGRGGDEATCVLMVPYHCGEEVYRRLKAVASTSDGFKIAEIDLQLRGPGEFLGTRQSGLPDFRVANLMRDSRLLLDARRIAAEWIERSPNVNSPEWLRVRTVLQDRWAGRLGLAEIG
jgi:ATP-dependent DNA helicase RecG